MVRSIGGGGKGGGDRGGGFGAAPQAPTFSERQLSQQRSDQKLQQQLAAARRQADELRAANARLQQQAAARMDDKGKGTGQGDDGDDDMEAEETIDALSEEERQRRVEALRAGMPYIELQFGADSPEMVAAKSDIEALQKASREAKPYKTHRAQVEKRKERLERQQAKATEDANELQRQIEELQERHKKIMEGIEARAKQVAAADEELRELLRKALAEGSSEDGAGAATAGGTQSAEQAAAAWSTFSATLSAMAAQPGMPAGWAEQMAGLMAQMQAAAVAIHQKSLETPATPAPPLAAGAKPTPAEATGRRWLGPGAAALGSKGAGGAQAGRASSSSLGQPLPKSDQPPIVHVTNSLAPGKLAADGAAATDQERAVAAAARESAAAASAGSAAAAAAGAGAAAGTEQGTPQQRQQPAQAAAGAADAATEHQGLAQAEGGGSTDNTGGSEGPTPARETGDDDGFDGDSLFTDAEDGDAMVLDRGEGESIQEHRRRLGRMATEKLRKRRKLGGKARGRSEPY